VECADYLAADLWRQQKGLAGMISFFVAQFRFEAGRRRPVRRNLRMRESGSWEPQRLRASVWPAPKAIPLMGSKVFERRAAASSNS